MGECSVGALDECRCSAAESQVVLRASDECSLASPMGHCLYAGAEFPGCSAGPDVCQTACEDLLERQGADLLMLDLMVVRASGCNATQQCAFVLESGQSCWVGPQLSSVDCNAGDEELLGGDTPP
jgi:hypothetical protein